MTISDASQLANAIRAEISKAIVGQTDTIDLMLTALLSGGHILLEGPPGTAKTFLARAFATALHLDFARIQFTPDLMPGDVIGSNIFDFRASAFQLTKGPVFTEFLLADEINRTPPKTQAALLEAMQERAVTIDGKTHALSPHFTVIATQNPIEQQGTYPLPEAQLDRFLFKHVLSYPGREEEERIVAGHGGSANAKSPADLGVAPAVDRGALAAAVKAVSGVRLSNEIVAYIVAMARATRETAAFSTGASPRAAAMLAAAARARAALDGRDYVIPDDVKALAVPAFRHRVVLSPTAEIEGRDADTAVRDIVEQVQAPR
ncbi:MAG: MoxR family ATPase [Parvularculaceae bacterium]